MMNRPCRVASALLFLLLAGNEVWAQRPLRELRALDFQNRLLRELELQRRTPTPLFQEIDPVFVLNEATITRMAYDPAAGVLRWRYSVRPGVARAVAARAARRLQSFVVDNLVRAGLVTQAQINAGEFRVEVLAAEEALPGGEGVPGVPERGGIEEGGGALRRPPQPVENAPQTIATTASVGYISYYPGWGCGWGWCAPPYWGCGWCGCSWWDGYYCSPWWGCGYYPVAYPTAAVTYAAPAAVVASATTVQPAATTSVSSAPRPAQLDDARLARISLAREAARVESQAPPTFWRQATGANPDGLFWDGYTLYWQGRYRDALDSFEAALAERRDDARFWYYKALCEKALGQKRAATASAQYARTLRAQALPAVEQVVSVLERVQGDDRRFLNGEMDVLARR